ETAASVVVTVLDSHNRPVTDLRSDQFNLRDAKGQSLNIDELHAGSETPLALLMLVDSSGSTRDGKLDAVKRQAPVFLNSLLADPKAVAILGTFQVDRAFTAAS